MAHKVKVNGTNYEVTGGRTLIGATGYDVSDGNTKIAATGYDVGFGEPCTVTFSGTSSYAGSFYNYFWVNVGFDAYLNNKRVSWPGTTRTKVGAVLEITSNSYAMDNHEEFMPGPSMYINVNGVAQGSSATITLTGNTTVKAVDPCRVDISY